MGIFDIFKSSAKAVDVAGDLLEKGASGIDKMFYTQEEKAIASQKYFEGWLDFQKMLGSESMPSAVSRRILAWIIAGVFCFLVVCGVAIYKVDPLWSKFIFEEGVSRLEFGFGAVITTYFVTGGIAKVIAANKSDSK